MSQNFVVSVLRLTIYIAEKPFVHVCDELLLGHQCFLGLFLTGSPSDCGVVQHFGFFVIKAPQWAYILATCTYAAVQMQTSYAGGLGHAIKLMQKEPAQAATNTHHL